MKTSATESPAPSSAPIARADEATAGTMRRRAKMFWLFLVALLAAFAVPFAGLIRLSLNNELYSHVLLVPAISVYLVWLDKRRLTSVFEPAPRLALGLFLGGLALLAGYWAGIFHGWQPEENDRLCVLILALVLCFSGGFAWCFGGRILRAVAFPLAFLIFMVPLPVVLENGLVTFLQRGSAETSYLMLKLCGMPILRDDLQFTMPGGVNIGVAPECSGIRSTLVLFITGLLAAQFFLRRPWAKLTLAAVMFPLGIFRNALRIFTLAELAVHVNPDILNSGLHHHGGPLFFAVSLVPFFLLLWLLRKMEK